MFVVCFAILRAVKGGRKSEKNRKCTEWPQNEHLIVVSTPQTYANEKKTNII